jgi:hypothetical protein
MSYQNPDTLILGAALAELSAAYSYSQDCSVLRAWSPRVLDPGSQDETIEIMTIRIVEQWRGTKVLKLDNKGMYS